MIGRPEIKLLAEKLKDLGESWEDFQRKAVRLSLDTFEGDTEKRRALQGMLEETERLRSMIFACLDGRAPYILSKRDRSRRDRERRRT